MLTFLRLQKVGVILSQSTKERDFIASTAEIKIMASLQNELGEKCAAALVSLDSSEGGEQVHFEVILITYIFTQKNLKTLSMNG